MKGWSSRRTVIKALAAAVCPLGGCQRQRDRALALVAGPPPASAASRLAIELVLGSVAAPERAGLLDDLASALASEMARRNPLMIDLVEERFDEVTARRGHWLWPVLNAAQRLAPGAWSDGQGGHVLAVGPSGAPASARLLPLWSDSATPGQGAEERARFAAWPLTYALWVRCLDSWAADALAARLRERVVERGALHALVIDRPLLDRHRPPSLGEIPSLAAIGVRRGAAPDPFVASLLALLASPAPEGPLLPWLAVSATDVVVVPREGALTRGSELKTRVREELAALGIRGTTITGRGEVG